MKTALYDRHVALGAKMVDFSGWEMPLQYQGIIPEHTTVRNHAGLFDVSHMGRIVVSGEDAEKFLDFVSSNSIRGKKDGSATYTVLCREDGTCVDDVIIYRQDPDYFFLIVNASNREKDLGFLKKEEWAFRVTITPRFKEEGILALQGPEAISYISDRYPDVKNLKPMTFIVEGDVILSATGYTGAGGIEIYAPHAKILALWDELIKKGVAPIGLGARDTLRLEMGYALYGHELSDSIVANESISAWTVNSVKLKYANFLAKDALQIPPKRFACGIKLLEKGVPREGYEIYHDGKNVGAITSGTFSPTLGTGIALALLNTKLPVGTSVAVKIRSNEVAAEITRLPFLPPRK